MTNKHTSTHHKKRTGHHQRRTKQFRHVYLPYLPLAISIVVSIIISGWNPLRGNTLAYATNTSVNGLLAATNAHRANHGAGALALNSKLVSAAQAKANDMVARNYWSHNTPDGQEPWVFVNNAGYKYLKAGENLAYGFGDSDGTVAGWMNSPTHKANMLDTAFTEVGFGFANSENFNNSGPETVVVAMYGKPQALAASQPAAPATPAAQPKPQTVPVKQTPSPTTEQLVIQDNQPRAPAPFTTDMAGLEPVSVPVTRAAVIAGPNASWAVFMVGLILGLSVAAMLMKHGLAVRRLLRNSEKFVLHHPLFDSVVIGLIILCITLYQTTGFIK